MTHTATDPRREFAVAVVRRLRERGHTAYWAGGCVRDQLRGVVPKDYDVATDARPDEIRRLFGHRRTLAVGAAFGVIAVLGPRKSAGQVEVATFREDAAYSDGRHPDRVVFSNPQHDAERRDFTINGLFYDPLEDQVIDFVQGRRDLERRLVRAIGDPEARFSEDKLRLLRAVRFAATLRFEIEAQTQAAIRRLASQISVVSPERISQEMRIMLVDANRVRAMELLYQTNLLAAVLPEVLPLVGARAESNDRSTGDLWQHALAMLAVLPPEPSLALVLAVLLHDVAPVSHVAGAADRGVEVAVEVGRRWRLPRKEEQRVAWLIAHQASLTDAAGQPWSRLQPLLTAPGIHDLVELVAAMARNGCAAREDVSHVRQLLRLPAEQLNPPPLLTGRDLSEMGLTPGPLFKQILDRVRDAQLDGALGSPSEARAWVAAFMGTPEDDPLSGA